MDPRKFPVREQGPGTGLARFHKYHSKTCMDENSSRPPSEVRKHANKKGTPRGVPFQMVGQKILRGCRFLDLPCGGHSSLFNRQLTGKKQAFENFIH